MLDRGLAWNRPGLQYVNWRIAGRDIKLSDKDTRQTTLPNLRDRLQYGG